MQCGVFDRIRAGVVARVRGLGIHEHQTHRALLIQSRQLSTNVRMLHGRLHLRSLRVLTEFYLAAGEWENALSSAGQLVQLDPLNETSHCLVFRAHKASGNASALENAYRTCGQILWRELSVEPSDQTQRLYRSLVNAGPAHVETGITPPAILFASTPSGSVAYTVFGEGVPVVIIPGFICHLEIAWEEPRLQRFLTSLSRTNRVVMFDRRGIALSERVGVSPTIEAGVADVQAILGAEKIERAVIFGASDGGAVAIRLAASKPERVAGLVMFAAMVCGSWRDDYPWLSRRKFFANGRSTYCPPGARQPPSKSLRRASRMTPPREPGGPACSERSQPRPPELRC